MDAKQTTVEAYIQRLRDRIEAQYAEAERQAKQILQDARAQRDYALRLLSEGGYAARDSAAVSVQSVAAPESEIGRACEYILTLRQPFTRMDLERDAGIKTHAAKRALKRLKEKQAIRVLVQGNGNEASRYEVARKGGDS